MSDKTFTNRLLSEMKGWVEDGLINHSQEQRIRSRYIQTKPETRATVRKEKTINTAKIVIVLASILDGKAKK